MTWSTSVRANCWTTLPTGTSQPLTSATRRTTSSACATADRDRPPLVNKPTHTHTHTHTFNGPFSGNTRVSRYQKGKTNLDFTEARDSEWQWHQLERRTTAAGGITSPREHDVPPITTQLRDVIVLQLYKS